MKYARGLKFNDYTLDGWRCFCGEIYFNPEQVQRVLLLNKLKKEVLRAKLGRNRSNLILRLPKDVEAALSLQEGEEVVLKVDKDRLEVIPA